MVKTEKMDVTTAEFLYKVHDLAQEFANKIFTYAQPKRKILEEYCVERGKFFEKIDGASQIFAALGKAQKDDAAIYCFLHNVHNYAEEFANKLFMITEPKNKILLMFLGASTGFFAEVDKEAYAFTLRYFKREKIARPRIDITTAEGGLLLSDLLDDVDDAANV